LQDKVLKVLQAAALDETVVLREALLILLDRCTSCWARSQEIVSCCFQLYLLTGVCYQSPSVSSVENVALLNMVKKLSVKHRVIFGDFDYPKIDRKFSIVI